MAENGKFSDFTVYLEGHDGHRGNVLVHAFLAKLHRLTLVLNKMERAFIESGVRQTDFEITGADKRNPTTMTLKPVPRVKAYDPDPAFRWAIHQIGAVARGENPDQRIRGEIASDLVKLATKESEDGYKAFWINGHNEAVRFDDTFLANATRIARRRESEDMPTRWRAGKSRGVIVGELLKVEALNADNEFVIVPPTGAKSVKCKFPPSLREHMGSYLFKIVRVSGVLHYGEESPFPFKVDVEPSGIQLYTQQRQRKTLSEMRGVFAGRPRAEVDWDALLGA